MGGRRNAARMKAYQRLGSALVAVAVDCRPRDAAPTKEVVPHDRDHQEPSLNRDFWAEEDTKYARASSSDAQGGTCRQPYGLLGRTARLLDVGGVGTRHSANYRAKHRSMGST